MPLKALLNWDDKCTFEEVIALCERRGDEVQVGYEGGEAALRTAVRRKGWSEARPGGWKIRYPATNQGDVQPSNWFAGTYFLKIATALGGR